MSSPKRSGVPHAPGDEIDGHGSEVDVAKGLLARLMRTSGRDGRQAAIRRSLSS